MIDPFWSRVGIVIMCCIVGYFVSIWQIGHQANVSHRYLLDRQQQEQLAQRSWAEKQLQSPQANYMDYYLAHKLYYDGVPDKYDQTGNKIKGIEPDPKRAIAYLTRACELSQSSQLWLRLASIYQNGMYNLEPDFAMAQRLYTHILQLFPDQYEARDRLNEVIQEINNIQTYRWLNLKYTPKKNQHHEKIKTLLHSGRVPAPAQIPTRPSRVTIVDQIFRAPDTEPEPELDINNIRFDDRHNTHNSQVVSTVAKSLKALKDGTEIKGQLAQTVREIRDYIQSKPDCDRRNDALKSLDSVERNIIPISSVDMRESEALNIVWNRINADQHMNHVSDIKDIFYHQLADMQEHGKSVCATGRLSRMMDTFSTFDKDVQIKPTYVIDSEMMSKAGKIREDMYSEYDSQTADLLRAGTAESATQSTFDQSVRKSIIDTLTKDYVDTGIMTENTFLTNVNEWIDEI
jgi:hypothetical protein